MFATNDEDRRKIVFNSTTEENEVFRAFMAEVAQFLGCCDVSGVGKLLNLACK